MAMSVLSRMSLSRKVPLFLALFLAVVLGTASAIEYVQLRRLLVTQAQERIAAVADLLANVLSAQLEDGQAEVRDEADRVAAARARDGEVPGAATDSALRSFFRLNAQMRTAWLVAPDGRCLRQATRDTLEGSVAESGPCTAAAPNVPADAGLISPIVAVDGQVGYRIRVPIESEEGQELLIAEHVLDSSETWALLVSLIAPDARALIGNADGSLWTDFGAVLPGPGPAYASEGMLEFNREGERRLGVASVMPGTPWAVLVHRNLDVVLAPSRSFLFLIAGSAFFALLLGWISASAISLRITGPLKAMTRGATAIADGDYSQRVPVERDDELGQLAGSFNVMAARVEESHQVLEERVQQRTHSLQQALEQLRQTQEELVRHERLAILGQLAGGVGHELRNPLGVMTNALYYLDLVMTDTPEKVREYMGILKTQIGVAETIVSDLLDFARVRDPQRAEVPVDALIASCLERAHIPDGVQLRKEVSVAVPPAFVDRGQMTQVLLNLVTNAVQAMDSQPQRRLTLAATANGEHVAIEVRDTGVGIPPEDLGRIFEPLVTTKARGIGLGLAVSRSLAHANGGEISVESTPGKGSSFRLVLHTADGIDADGTAA
jgi:signal transduction histidine kinase